MKKSLKIISHWMLLGIGFIIVLWIGYFALKARQTTNPWLSESSPVGGLYVTSNETLTAAKRNALTKRATREDVATTDTNDFDITCDRRYTTSDVLRIPIAITSTRIRIITSVNTTRKLDSTNKSKIILSSDNTTSQNVTNLQKKCK